VFGTIKKLLRGNIIISVKEVTAVWAMVLVFQEDGCGRGYRLRVNVVLTVHMEICNVLFTVVQKNWCGYKTNGLNFFPLPRKLGNSKRYVVLAYALPSIHGYNLKVVRQNSLAVAFA
jgi:hypothetical protein